MSKFPLLGAKFKSYADMRAQEIRHLFHIRLRGKNFVTSKTGVKTIELIGSSFIANEPAIFGEDNDDYVQRELGEKYYEQYSCVLDELLDNPNSRRASVIYNRPSTWAEHDENGENDFICTNAVTYYIINDRLDCVVQMRSNEVIFGYRNAFAWQENVLLMLLDDLNEQRQVNGQTLLERGEINWQVQNLHMHEKHFYMIEEHFAIEDEETTNG